MYFTKEELERSSTARDRGIDNTIPEEYTENVNKLISLLDTIRQGWGSPILVNSGYRCPQLNRVVGGSKTSQHLTASAADIRPKKGSVKQLFDYILELIKRGEIEVGQLIDEYNYSWVHVSIPNSKHSNQVLHIK